LWTFDDSLSSWILVYCLRSCWHLVWYQLRFIAIVKFRWPLSSWIRNDSLISRYLVVSGGSDGISSLFCVCTQPSEEDPQIFNNTHVVVMTSFCFSVLLSVFVVLNRSMFCGRLITAHLCGPTYLWPHYVIFFLAHTFRLHWKAAFQWIVPKDWFTCR